MKSNKAQNTMKKTLFRVLLAFVFLGGSAIPNGVAAQKSDSITTKVAESHIKDQQSEAKEQPAADNTVKETQDKATNSSQKATVTEKTKKEKPIEITIHQDTTIVISEIPGVKERRILVYGDAVTSTPISNKDFKNEMSKLNKGKDKQGFTPSIETIDGNKKPTINIKYDDFSQKSDVYYFRTVYYNTKSKQWEKKDTVEIYIIKGEPATDNKAMLEQRTPATTNEAVDESESEDHELQAAASQSNTSSTPLLEVILLLISLLTLALAIFCMLKIKRMREDLDIQGDKLRRLEQQSIPQPTNVGMNENRVNEIARREATNAVKTLMGELGQAMRTVPQPTVPNPQAPVSVLQPEETDIDTTDVEYNSNENTFVLKPTKLHHIRIFSQGGRYYFCLSDIILDSEAATQAWVGTIGTYQQCIQYTMSNPSATHIRIVEDGELRKDGERFVVTKKMVIDIQ